MSVTPIEILKLASDLQLSAASEVEFRNTVGRAYYAAYHLALQFYESLPSPGAEPTSPLGMHMQLVYRLDNPGIPEPDERFQASRRLGIKLKGFHRLRIKADYRLQDTTTSEDARDSIIKAREIERLVS